MWGLNPRPPDPQSGALPTELIAPYNTFGSRHPVGDCKSNDYFRNYKIRQREELVRCRKPGVSAQHLAMDTSRGARNGASLSKGEQSEGRGMVPRFLRTSSLARPSTSVNASLASRELECRAAQRGKVSLSRSSRRKGQSVGAGLPFCAAALGSRCEGQSLGAGSPACTAALSLRTFSRIAAACATSSA